ncbi:MAG: two-component system response regulator RppA [Lyngbya sp.]|nr:two-component system response regulator RppA [Lyngbya sp.]
MKILLVEDEPDLGAAIKHTLTQNSYIVDWVMNGEEACVYLESQWTDYTLTIFDWLLPGLSGLQLCQMLRQKGSSIPILMLTAKDTEADKISGLDAGADDYLVKPFGMGELLARLRALLRRSPQLKSEQLKLGNLILDYRLYTLSCQQVNGKIQTLNLTNKEFQLLDHFLRHPEQIITRDRLLNQLWEVGSEPESNVVAAQIRLLRRKLAEIGCDRYIETVYGLGYRFSIPKT